tara:strand:+ start:178 stop:432 length:255 start_codon:yes stop_codon:yes gene_type:complete
MKHSKSVCFTLHFFSTSNLVTSDLSGATAQLLIGNDLYIANNNGSFISKIDSTRSATTSIFVTSYTVPNSFDFKGNELYFEEPS